MNLRGFNRFYLTAASLLLAIEVFIAFFIRDNFIRPYLGDVLVVILIYCAVMSLFPFPKTTTALYVLAFSFTAEALQYARLVEKLGLENSVTAKTIMGTTFAWTDLVAYVTGIAFVLWFEHFGRTWFKGYQSGTVVQTRPGSSATTDPRAPSTPARNSAPGASSIHQIK
jgi:hypothetical protein